MDRPTLTVADVFRRSGDTYRDHTGPSLSMAHRRVMAAIAQCRTAALGGHVEQCDRCGHARVWYNSCRNRHCPSCQSLARAAWIEDRTADLLDTEYFHVVFTVPQAVAEIAAQNKAVVYRIHGSPSPSRSDAACARKVSKWSAPGPGRAAGVSAPDVRRRHRVEAPVLP